MKELDTTPVRIKKDLVKRVKNYTSKSGMTISGFVNLALESMLTIYDTEYSKNGKKSKKSR